MWGVIADRAPRKAAVGLQRTFLLKGYRSSICCRVRPVRNLPLFWGNARGGMWGGLLAGLCFSAPCFLYRAHADNAHAILGVTPIGRGALYGVGPVVLGILGVAAYRLGKSTVCTIRQTMIAIVAVAALIGVPWGLRRSCCSRAAWTPALSFQKDRCGCSRCVNGPAQHTAVYLVFTSATVTAMPQGTPLSPTSRTLACSFSRLER